MSKYNITQYIINKAFTKPARWSWIASLVRRLYNPVQPDKCCFIVGCYNSGTTLLEYLLGMHPKISTLDEGVFRTDQLVTPEELGWPRMLHKVLDKVRPEHSDKYVNADALKKDWAIFFDRSKPVFLEKSIVNSARILELQRHFDNAYFINIVRNGYAVAEGIRRKTAERQHKWSLPSAYQPMYPIEMCAMEWVVNNQIIDEDVASTYRFRKVYYEDLCRNPYETINELFIFLGLDLDHTLKHNRNFSERLLQACKDVQNMNKNSIARLTSQDVRAIEEVASSELIHQGYRLMGVGKD